MASEQEEGFQQEEQRDKARVEQLMTALAANPDQETIGQVHHLWRRAVHAEYLFRNSHVHAMKRQAELEQQLAQAREESATVQRLLDEQYKLNNAMRALLAQWSAADPITLNLELKDPAWICGICGAREAFPIEHLRQPPKELPLPFQHAPDCRYAQTRALLGQAKEER